MSKQGYIKLYRQIQDCWVWEQPGPFDERSAWIDLLMSANHDDHKTMFDGQLIVVKRGQWITSVRKLADRWRWGNQKTLKFLRALEEDGMIDRDANSRRTLITIANYEKFQGSDNGNGTLNGTLNGTVPEHCSTTNKNSKNEKNSKKDNKTPIVPFTDNQELNEALKAFREHRKAIKSPMTDNAVQILVKRLRKLSADPKEQVLMLEVAIEHGWKTVYPLKEEDKLQPVEEDYYTRLMREVDEDLRNEGNTDITGQVTA